MSAAGVIAGLGSLAQIAGSYYTNMQNAKTQLAINKNNIGMQYAFNADQIAVAQMNNQTQIDMANTAHQREVQDLRDANLNPILSATGGNGAAMPSLGNPSGMDAPSMSAYVKDNPLRELGTSAKEFGRLMTSEYEAEVALAQEKVKEQQIYNNILSHQERDQYYQTALHNYYNRAELDALEDWLDPILNIDSNGNAAVRKPFWDDNALNPQRFNSEILSAIRGGIRSDIHNRRFDALQRWVDTGAKAVSAGAKAVSAAKGGPTGDLKFGNKSY